VLNHPRRDGVDGKNRTARRTYVLPMII